MPDAKCNWIKVETGGLPKESGRYLVHIADSKTTVVSEFHVGQRGWDYGYVTHWMPIPEVP